MPRNRMRLLRSPAHYGPRHTTSEIILMGVIGGCYLLYRMYSWLRHDVPISSKYGYRRELDATPDTYVVPPNYPVGCVGKVVETRKVDRSIKVLGYYLSSGGVKSIEVDGKMWEAISLYDEEFEVGQEVTVVQMYDESLCIVDSFKEQRGVS